MYTIKFFSESDQIKEVLEKEGSGQSDKSNFLVNLISNVVEWSKWDLDKILDMPFTPMMIVVNSVLKQRAEKEAEDEPPDAYKKVPSSPTGPSAMDTQTLSDVLQNPDKY